MKFTISVIKFLHFLCLRWIFGTFWGKFIGHKMGLAETLLQDRNRLALTHRAGHREDVLSLEVAVYLGLT